MAVVAQGDEGSSAGLVRFLDAFDARAAAGFHAFPDDQALWRGVEATANLADVLHYLCVLHGRHPGVVDFAVDHVDDPRVREWLSAAADAFAAERAFLARLVAEAGPIPSTAVQAESEAAVLGQRHALEMLARSDRAGCAVGCAGALMIAWRDVRALLDRGAARLGVTRQSCVLPEIPEVRAILSELAASPARARAILFGAEQTFIQQRGFWDLLESRCISRRSAG